MPVAEAACADHAATAMEPVGGTGSGLCGDVEGNPARPNDFGGLKHNLTNHWRVQDRRPRPVAGAASPGTVR
jgi:hypothetical protein